MHRVPETLLNINLQQR
jgi:hypothetical protein